MYEATAHEATSFEKFEMAFNDFFQNGFDAESFPVGKNVGCISQELFDQISEVYDEAMYAMNTEDLSDEVLDYVTARIKAAQKAYEEGRIRIEDGKYYAFVCLRSNDMVYEDDANNLKATQGMASLPANITLNEAKYIFKLENAGDGYFYIQNLATGNYMGANPATSAQWKTIATASNMFTFPQCSNTIYKQEHFSGKQTHIDGYYKMVSWNGDGSGNQYHILAVDEAQVAPLLAAVEKQKFVNKYQNYYDIAQGVLGKYRYASGLTLDGNYAAAGLVGAEQASTNAQEQSEGPLANAFDGKFDTFFHTKWQGAVADNDYDWIQVDLGKEVQDLAVKFSKRQRDLDENNPLKIALVAPAEGEELSGTWSDTLYKDNVIYQYSTEYTNGTKAASTAVVLTKLARPTQHLRFVTLQTEYNTIKGDVGPIFNLSELRFYEEDGSENPVLNLIPEAIRTELDNQLAATAAMLADVDNTSLEALQAGYDALVAAVEAF